MADVAFVAVLLAFFALATLFVRGCERIIGSEEAELTAADAAAPEIDPERTAA
jgi:hypothetical protein